MHEVFKYDYYRHNPLGRTGKNCSRNTHAFSRLLAQRQRSRRAASPRWFLACQGDTSTELLKHQVPRIPSNARVITLTIGGNDLSFSDILDRCARFYRSCTAAIQDHFGVHNEKLFAFAHRLDRVYWRIRAKAPYARVIVAGYPRLLPRSHAPSGCGGIDSTDARNLNIASDNLNLIIRRAVGRHQGFRFVDVARAFDGHGSCQHLSRRVWINPIVIAGVRHDYSMHPDLRGQRAYANLIARANADLFR